MEPVLDEDETLAVRLMERIRAAIRSKNPTAHRRFLQWSKENPAREIYLEFEIGNLLFQEHQEEWFVVYESSPMGRLTQVFDGKMALGRPTFTWQYDTTVNTVMPALDKALVLDDLSEI